MKLQQVDPLTDADWDEEVRRHPEGSIFHGSGWARVLASCYGHEPCFFRLRGDSELRALVPLFHVHGIMKGSRGVSVPFADFGEPLCFDPGSFAEVKSGLETRARESSWRYLELRGSGDESAPPRSAATFLSHRLELAAQSEEQFEKVRPAARRAVRKAEAAGLRARVSTAWEDLLRFFDLHVRTRRAHGSPPQPLKFFRLIHAHLIERGLGFVTVVEDAGRPVAAAVFLRSGRNAVFKFGASDRKALADRPNHLAIWIGIRELINQGAEQLSFGRTTPVQEGLCRFKRSWGAVEEPLFYHRFSPDEALWSVKAPESGAPGCPVFQFMPLPINRLAGRILYPQFD